MSGIGVPHHAENEGHKRVGIFIAVLAVVMAIVSALAKAEANSMIVKQVEASNGYAWYQAKRQRTYLNELEFRRIEIDLAGAPSAAQRALLEEQRSRLKAKNAEYETEGKEILVKSDATTKAAEFAGHRHHRFEYAEILLHIAVVMGSLTLLTDTKLFFRIGIGATALGIAMGVLAFVETPHKIPIEGAQNPVSQSQNSAEKSASGH